MIIRLVIKDKNKMIVDICEMERYRRDGKRDLQTLELFLDKAQECIDKCLIPCIEFPEAYLPQYNEKGE